MASAKRKTPIPKKGKESSFRSFLTGLRKKRIIEILAAFIGGGWLILEFVHWILIDHYHFPEESLDITFITLACALICTLIWRIFSGVKKKARKIKVEFILIPLVILITAFFDVRLIQQIGRPEAEIISETRWKNSIAVLPFANISPEEGQEYFCDGLTEELINRLSTIKELKVPARTSAFAFKGEKIDIRDVGQKLNVDKVLEGSVRKTGNRLRITAQLINVADGYHLWSEKYDRKLEDIFAIQDEISLAIVNKLKVKLLGKEKAKIVKRHTENIEAFNLYLRGRYFWNKRTEPGLKKAIDYFEQAIKTDPNYALAYSGLADSYNLLWKYGTYATVAFPKAKEVTLKALEIDNTLSEAHTSLAYIKAYYDFEWSTAEREFKRAIELNPAYATAHHWYAMYLMRMARFEEAIEEIKRARELDPLSLIIIKDKGQCLYYARHYNQAIESLQRTIEMDPNFPFVHHNLGLVYLQKSMYEEALSEFQKEKGISINWKQSYKSWIGIAYVKMGKRNEALKVLDGLIERSKEAYVSPYCLAVLYFALRENDHGFKWLDKAYKERDTEIRALRVDPALDSVRLEPRYRELLKKMNLE